MPPSQKKKRVAFLRQMKSYISARKLLISTFFFVGGRGGLFFGERRRRNKAQGAGRVISNLNFLIGREKERNALGRLFLIRNLFHFIRRYRCMLPLSVADSCKLICSPIRVPPAVVLQKSCLRSKPQKQGVKPRLRTKDMNDARSRKNGTLLGAREFWGVPPPAPRRFLLIPSLTAFTIHLRFVFNCSVRFLRKGANLASLLKSEVPTRTAGPVFPTGVQRLFSSRRH